MGVHGGQLSLITDQLSVLQFSVFQFSGLCVGKGLCGEEDGEHGHEPEGEGEIEVLGVGEAADEGEYKKSGGEGFEVPGCSAANLAEEDPVERDGEDDADGSEREELLEEFVMGLLCFKFADGRDNESIGVEAISEKGLFDCVFEGDSPDEGAAG